MGQHASSHTLHICLKCTRTCLKPGPPWAWVEGRKTRHALSPCVFLSEVSTCTPVAMTSHSVYLQMTTGSSIINAFKTTPKCILSQEFRLYAFGCKVSYVTSTGSLSLDPSLSPSAKYLLKKLGDLLCSFLHSGFATCIPTLQTFLYLIYFLYSGS